MSDPYRLRVPRPIGPLGVDADLGPLERAFHASAERSSVAAAAPFVVLLAYVVWLAQHGELSRWFNSTFSAAAAAALFILATGLIVRTAAGAEVIRVHAHGLVDLRAGPRVVRWDEIESVTAVWSPEQGRILRHVLRTTGGDTLPLGRSIAGVDELVESLRVRIAEHGLPAIRARIAQGSTVRFGPVAASEEGLGVGDATLRWEDVASVASDDGEVVVRGPGGARLAAARLDDVPNAFLLKELARRR